MPQEKIPLEQPSSNQDQFSSSSDLLAIDQSSKRQNSITYYKDINKKLQAKTDIIIAENSKDDFISKFINDFQMKKFQKWVKDFYYKREQWQNIDFRAAKAITDWKKEYILKVQDLRLRSIAMAGSAAIMYKMVSIRTVSNFGRLRNLGISFAFMGMIWTPQLFNPFLKRN